MSPSRTDVPSPPERPIAGTGTGTGTGTGMFTLNPRRSERDGLPIRTAWATVPAEESTSR
ncbi:hypothetical protein ACIQM0_04750 [Streptomyces sp. NPDC091387]|uniref:hypothetical protein n=1 Tax=Streptomyces sp. NPDC091387 TaxID=3365998 RepID=UPI00380C38B4